MAFAFQRNRRGALAVAAALCAAPLAAAFGQGYPAKPIQLIVPFPPGGPTDTASRIIGEEIGKKLGQTVVVENRAGASGAIAAAAVAHAAPDGYTLMTLATPTLLAPHMYDSVKFDMKKDFTPVAGIYDLPIVMVVNPKTLDVDSLQGLIDKAKTENGALNYTSSGVGSFGHLSMELLKKLGGFQMTHIPYRGSSPAITDLLGGQVPMMYADLVAALPHIKAGSLRALAVGSPERVQMVPEVPTIAEQGFPQFESVSWGGLLAPAGTPQDVVGKLSAAVESVLADAQVQQRLLQAGAIGHYRSPEALGKHIATEFDKWGEVVRENNLGGK